MNEITCLNSYGNDGELRRRLLKFRDFPILFISIPKNASSSIKQTYAKYYMGREIPAAKSHNPSESGFLTRDIIGKHNFFDLMVRQSINKFVVLRDPLERALSGYLNKIKGTKLNTFRNFASNLDQEVWKFNEKKLSHLQKNYTFELFLEQLQSMNDIDRNAHFRTQTCLAFDFKLNNTCIFDIKKLNELENWLYSITGKKVKIISKSRHITNASSHVSTFKNNNVLNLVKNIYFTDYNAYENIE